MKKNYPLFGSVLLAFCLILSAGQVHAQDTWTVYHADVMPAEATPPFVASNYSPAISTTAPAVVATEQSIIDNPDMAGGKVLSFKINGNPHTSGMWRRDLPAATSAATIAVRAKGLPDVDRVFELDLDFGGFRETVYILSNGTYSLRSNSQAVSLGENFNAMAWHTYRFAKSGSTVNMYVDENNTPVATISGLTLTTTNNYYRFGDGTGTPSYGALIDWLAWDPSGAYSPTQRALPSVITSLAAETKNAAFNLSQNYPNPFNSSTTIAFELKKAGYVTLEVYDITGKQVAQLANGSKTAGAHEIKLDANLRSGIYFYKLNANGATATRKMVVAR